MRSANHITDYPVPSSAVRDHVVELQQQLDLRADLQTKHWWERYLKHSIPFRGVKMAGIRATVHTWIKQQEDAPVRAPETLLELALDLLRQEYAEDKLAGIVLLQEVLLPARAIVWQRDLPRFAALFHEEAIYEWNTCDWLCVKVLGPLAQQGGPACAYAISAWRDADHLWQRRAAGVAFVNLAPQGEANFPGFTTMLLETCAATVRSPERFAQTGTGWVLRELSRAEPERVAALVEEMIEHFSSEGLRYAVEQLPPPTKERLKHLYARRVGKNRTRRKPAAQE